MGTTTISFRHIDPDESLRAYAEEKMARLQKYVEVPLDIHVVLSLERKYRQRVDVMCTLNGTVINAHEVMDDMRAAIDKILDKLERRLIRYREKLKKYREVKPKYTTSFQEQGSAKIIIPRTIDAKPMDHEEAIMQLEASGNSFMIFRDRGKGNVCVVYKRKDGNFSLIETTGKTA
ncbi:ribosome hibernation-promoting factor, HPF/YfiA family [Syntrophorhabdus aromaticivorans]|jgi:putative sigma-54 modulation protein|uniref:Ribosome hibernation promoting factor n=1 Tax=Syntrophorhabdus aromaticivorans TaxID=328301 RepID=A0A351U3L3_9BACT|nr:ribosome-associated translation inhibitor RaiA [Syntrophorhabdus aromaticivorans]NLW34033.1 ribosome-associated translation inhibitor RaiA [Syntrophorhabdus aromaticivorans]HBA54544.1 ribosome-associated translation inhibitor RaiA [Syntrophorhabdus aromaticivorans]